ncbi:ABC transporter permease [Sporosarcina sp. 179-K 3D1 HS]|uniref:ABC transporter permease n=1 Tax=Sporosarcina sp. 179-K 3D1 HS TaxID=3232169 RepID=UPI0039A0D74E
MNKSNVVIRSLSSVNENTKNRNGEIWKRLLTGFVLLIFAFLLVPILVVIPMSFSSANTLQFPPPGFSLKWYQAFFQDSGWLVALRTSFYVAIASSSCSLIIGIFAAYGLARNRFKGRKIILANILAPMIIPQIITAVGLYLFFNKIGLVGTIPGLIIGHTVLSVPFVILIIMLAIGSLDIRIEHAARSLGANWITTFFKIIFPNIVPSVISAWFFAFIVSFDELIVTIFLGGEYVTVPKKMFNELILQINPIITVVSTLLIFVTVGFVILAIFTLRKYKRTFGFK